MKKLALLLIVLTSCVVQQIPANTTKPMHDVEEVLNMTSEPVTNAQPEIQDTIPTKRFLEGQLVHFPNLKAIDPDGDPITYTFSAPLNDRGEWQTRKGDRGSYLITVTASDGQNTVSEKVRVIVEPENYEPELTIANSNIHVREGDVVRIQASSQDKDGDNVTIQIRGWMDNLTKKTDYNDAGTHKVFITASDGKDSVSKEVLVEVENVNRAPILKPVPPIKVTEGETVIVVPSATDPDRDKLTYEFSPPLNSEGIWETKKGDSGERTATITVSDGELIDTKSVVITVEKTNLEPIINVADSFSFEEGETAIINYTVTDPEGEPVSVSFSGFMTSNKKQLSYKDAGSHQVTITASDGVKQSTKTITINVADKNRPPVFAKNSFD